MNAVIINERQTTKLGTKYWSCIIMFEISVFKWLAILHVIQEHWPKVGPGYSKVFFFSALLSFKEILSRFITNTADDIESEHLHMTIPLAPAYMSLCKGWPRPCKSPLAVLRVSASGSRLYQLGQGSKPQGQGL